MACSTEEIIIELSGLMNSKFTNNVNAKEIKITKENGYGKILEKLVMLGQEHSKVRVTYDKEVNQIQQEEVVVSDDKLTKIQKAIKARDNINSQTKEYEKSLVSNQFIGEGSRSRKSGDGRSSTAFYEDIYKAEELANTGIYTADDVVFVSSNGYSGAHVKVTDKDGKLVGAYTNLDKAIAAGSSIIMDTKGHATSGYNKNGGEKILYDYMSKQEGYTYTLVTKPEWTYTNKKGTVVKYGYGKWEKKESAQEPELTVAEKLMRDTENLSFANAKASLEKQERAGKETVVYAKKKSHKFYNILDLKRYNTKNEQFTHDEVNYKSVWEAYTKLVPKDATVEQKKVLLRNLMINQFKNSKKFRDKLISTTGNIKYRTITSKDDKSFSELNIAAGNILFSLRVFAHKNKDKVTPKKSKATKVDKEFDKTDGISIHSKSVDPLGKKLTNVQYKDEAINIIPSDKTLTDPKDSGKQAWFSQKAADKYGKQTAYEVWGNSVEAWYKTNNAKAKGITEGSVEANKHDTDLMQGLILDKLKQYPDLYNEITDRGGVDFLKKSYHSQNGKGRWESGGENLFMKTLIEAYDLVIVKKKEPKKKPKLEETKTEPIKIPTVEEIKKKPAEDLEDIHSLIFNRAMTFDDIMDVLDLPMSRAKEVMEYLSKYPFDEKTKKYKNEIPFQTTDTISNVGPFDKELDIKLRKILKRLFPGIRLKYTTETIDPRGGLNQQNTQVKGQANIKAKTVLINSLLQTQDTLPHEYAHHYIAMFRDIPLVQEAIKKWGSEEALVQAIGEEVVAQKGKAYGWWQEFSQWVKNKFNNISDKDKYQLKELLTDAFLTNRDLTIEKDSQATITERFGNYKIFDKDQVRMASGTVGKDTIFDTVAYLKEEESKDNDFGIDKKLLHKKMTSIHMVKTEAGYEGLGYANKILDKIIEDHKDEDILIESYPLDYTVDQEILDGWYESKGFKKIEDLDSSHVMMIRPADTLNSKEDIILSNESKTNLEDVKKQMECKE